MNRIGGGGLEFVKQRTQNPYPIYDNKTSQALFVRSFFFLYYKSVYVLVCCSKVYIVLYRKRISLDCVRMSVCFMFVY